MEKPTKPPRILPHEIKWVGSTLYRLVHNRWVQEGYYTSQVRYSGLVYYLRGVRREADSRTFFPKQIKRYMVGMLEAIERLEYEDKLKAYYHSWVEPRYRPESTFRTLLLWLVRLLGRYLDS